MEKIENDNIYSWTIGEVQTLREEIADLKQQLKDLRASLRALDQDTVAARLHSATF